MAAMKNIKYIFGFFLILAGLSILFDIDIFRIVIPILLIFFGIRVLSGRSWEPSSRHSVETQDDVLNEVAIFTGVSKIIKSQEFSGGKAAMIFSGGRIDLSRVRSRRKEIEIELVAIFGGIRLIVPADWKVKSEGAAIVGGYDNRTSGEAGKTVLRVTGAAIFGGVEIVN
jgi:predicted membrane protein